MELFITSIKYLNENKPDEREMEITLSNNTVVHAQALYESWQQWGGTQNELFVTMPVVEDHNEWLHGGDRPWQ